MQSYRKLWIQSLLPLSHRIIPIDVSTKVYLMSQRKKQYKGQGVLLTNLKHENSIENI